jgi:exopolyphosphatase/guanosine-5'-triphosphate,3'-diphosphate pyrophosphatase
MRLGVLDVGSNTVHLLVVDAHPGARPWPAYSHKTELRLAEHLTDDGHIDAAGADSLVAFVREAQDIADDRGAEETLAFATSAIREAPNGEEVLARVATEAGVDLQVLPGDDEARLTFLAVRRWFGWSSGRLLVLDIGGGSLEIASGIDEEPDVVASLPLGAGRMTRDWLTGDPPDAKDVKAMRKHVRAEIAKHIRKFSVTGQADAAVGSSKTFRSLARITGAAPSGEGAYVHRVLEAKALANWVTKLAGMTAKARADLPGVSRARAGQLLAGAVVADAAMDLFGVERLEICPWALREGIILRRLDWMQEAW